MPKNIKNLLVLGTLFAVIILVYGKSIFKKAPKPQENIPRVVQSTGENVAETVPGAPEVPPRTKRIPPGWGRDPFVAEEPTATKLTRLQQPRKLFLSGIAHKEGLYLAIIDGKVVKKGDIIEGREITNITEDRVTLKKNDKIEILKLREE